MALRNVCVRVVGNDGRPKSGRRVWLTGSGYGSGVSKESVTGSDGTSCFDVNYDGRIEIYIDGTRRVRDEPIRADFRIVL